MLLWIILTSLYTNQRVLLRYTLLGEVEQADGTDELASVRRTLLACEVIHWRRPELLLRHLLQLADWITGNGIGKVILNCSARTKIRKAEFILEENSGSFLPCFISLSKMKQSTKLIIKINRLLIVSKK